MAEEEKMQKVMLPDGTPGMFPADMAQDQIRAFIRTKYPQEHPWATATREARGNPEKAKADVMKMARMAAGLEKPQTFDDHVLMTLGTAPAFMAGGAGAGLLAARLGAGEAIVAAAPILGRIITSGALSKARGEGNLETAVNMAGAGIAEGVMGAAGKVLGGPAATMEAIGERVKQAAGGRINFDKALAWWKADPSKTVQASRAREIAKELNKKDPEGVAGKMFLEEVAKPAHVGVGPAHAKIPRPSVGVSKTAKDVASNPGARALADAAIGHEPVSAMAVGAAPAMAAKLHVPGAKHVTETIEEAE